MSTSEHPPLFIDFARSTQAELSAAGEYVRSKNGDDAAELFGERVAQAFQGAASSLAQEIAASDHGKPFGTPDPVASVRWAQPVYRLRVETAAKRRRGSSAGLWYAYYALHDKGGAGKPDTLHVFSFVHSATEPMGTDAD